MFKYLLRLFWLARAALMMLFVSNEHVLSLYVSGSATFSETLYCTRGFLHHFHGFRHRLHGLRHHMLRGWFLHLLHGRLLSHAPFAFM